MCQQWQAIWHCQGTDLKVGRKGWGGPRARALENMGAVLRSMGVIQWVLEAPRKTQLLQSLDCPFLSPTHRTAMSSPPQKEWVGVEERYQLVVD